MNNKKGNSKFVFSDVDEEGMATLNAIAEADKFNYWMYQTIKPYCVGQILEIGSGIGNISQYFINDNAHITLSDIRNNYCDMLQEKFKSYAMPVVNINLVINNFESVYSNLLDTFDSVFALNVIEHIENDELAIANAIKLLKPNGNLVILVPAYQFLYNKFDKSLEHYRRYNKILLKNKLLSASDTCLVKLQYFNFVGIFGWLIFGWLQKDGVIKKDSMKLYNAMTPLFKMIDKIVLNKMGLSVIGIVKKTK